jgi:hypothetical protein
MDEEALRKLTNTSGFPFQLRVEHEVRSTTSQHGWTVLAAEYPWRHPRVDQQGYTDLVLCTEGLQHLILECKRLSEGGKYVFLCPHKTMLEVVRARCCWVARLSSGRQIGWIDLKVLPGSEESGYCVVPGTGPKDRPLLERIAGELVIAAEAIGADRESVHPTSRRDRTWFFCPLIVTNADLYVCRFDPADVDLRTGNLNAGVAAFEAVPYIRFRKGLSTDLPPVSDEIDLTGLSTQRERTVFVVSAGALVEFLTKWNISGAASDAPLPWEPTNTQRE